METFKLSIEVNEKRQVIFDLPENIPLDQAEVLIIVQPLKNGHPRKGEVDLAVRGITPEQAAETRQRVMSFAEDWNAPGIEVYDEL